MAARRKCLEKWQQAHNEYPDSVVGVKIGKYLAFWGEDAREVNQLIGGGALPKVGGMYFLALSTTRKFSSAIPLVRDTLQERLIVVQF